ncbi:hypothetical protein J2X66_001582 [Pseudomonas sp. 3296]|nr:hypothetical protein [Pseudomonas sp. 3296]
MTMGPGRSDCYRVGVTYGYRECLRKGRVRQSCDANSPGHQGSTNLRRASFAKSRIPERIAHLPLCHFRYIPRKNISRCFFVTVYRESRLQMTAIFRS